MTGMPRTVAEWLDPAAVAARTADYEARAAAGHDTVDTREAIEARLTCGHPSGYGLTCRAPAHSEAKGHLYSPAGAWTAYEAGMRQLWEAKR